MPSQDTAHTLVLDTAPLLTAPLSSLVPLARRFVTTSDVLNEVRGKGQRERLEREWGTVQVQLTSPSNEEDSDGTAGLKVREPSTAAISQVTLFARQTGDLAVLSATDIRVVALAYDVEVEANGSWRLRDKVGGQRRGKDPQKKQARLARKLAQVQIDDVILDNSETQAEIQLEKPIPDQQPGEQSTEIPHRPVDQPSAEVPDIDDDGGWSHVPIRGRPSAPSEASSSSSSFASDGDPSWITPDNLHLHHARDLNVFPGVPQNAKTGNANIAASMLAVKDESSTEEATKQPTMKVALLTGDFAMQNVALQMGLNVLGVGGKRIRDVKTWVLRCYGCFKLCKDPTKKFCPSCGGATLTRVSITYTPSSATGYVLHLKDNFQYRNRGTVYSIPSAKPGSASFAKGAARRARQGVDGSKLVLREDQKEFQRGVKRAQVARQKEEKRLASHTNNDADWEPAMFKGSNGSRGVVVAGGVAVGRDGLPVLGYGRNPNEARRR